MVASPQRGKGLPMAHIQKKCVCSAVFKGDRAWGLPPVKAETEIFRFFFLQHLPSPWFVVSHVGCTAHSIHSSLLPPLHLLPIAFLFIFSSLTFQFSFSFPSFRILSCIWVSFLFYNHRVLPSLSLPTLGALPGQPGTGALGDPSTFQGKRWQSFGACSADRAWVWQCWNWLPISTAGHFPFALEGLLQSWKLHLLGLYRLKNLKYFLWDRAQTKGSIHQKYDAMDFHNPACRQTALDKCVFIIAAQLSSAFPTSFSLKIGKIKVTF